jgi:hypothetical protein
MEGKWRFCGQFPNAPSDAVGVQYGPASTAPTPNGGTVGGDMYLLVDGPSGPVPGQGFAYQFTYDVSPEGPGSFQLNMFQNGGGFGGPFVYSPCPRELQLTNDFNPDMTLLVPFD